MHHPHLTLISNTIFDYYVLLIELPTVLAEQVLIPAEQKRNF